MPWNTTLVDLFFANIPLLASAGTRVQHVPFEGATIPVISAEDLTVFKVAFNRPKDWTDVEDMITVQGPRFDHAYARHWLADLVGDDDPRYLRFVALAAAA